MHSRVTWRICRAEHARLQTAGSALVSVPLSDVMPVLIVPLVPHCYDVISCAAVYWLCSMKLSLGITAEEQ